MQYFPRGGKLCRNTACDARLASSGRHSVVILLRTFLATLVLLLAIAVPPIATAENTPLRIGVQIERPPFSFRDAEGELQGFDVEIAWALCATLRAKCELAPLGFTDLIPGLQQQRIDAAVASMSITEERLQRVDFTDKYYQASNRFVARRDALAESTPASLAGKTIGVKRGTVHDRYLTAEYAGTAAIRRYGYSDEIFIDLALGRLDLAFADGITLTESFLKTDLGAEFGFAGPALSDPRWFGHGEGIAIRKGNSDLLARLNQALRQILSDGTYEEIRSKYFDYDIYGDASALAQPLENVNRQ
jgi:arginine/ornithine transport system substrate-binding protein